MAGYHSLRPSDAGWAVYNDTVYTPLNLLTILTSTTIDLPNNAGSVLNSKLPAGNSDWYDGVKLRPHAADEYYILAVRFMAAPSIGSVANLDFGIDLGGTQGVQFEQQLTFPKGAGVFRPFSIVIPFYTGVTFLANGGTVKLSATAGGNITVHTIQYQIAKLVS